MTISRREALTFLAAGGFACAGGGVLPLRSAWAAGKELSVEILGFSLAIHMPALAALNEGLPALGEGKPKLTRIDSMRVLTQSIVAGSAEVGESDVVSALRASEAGADIKIVGMVYANTSQVYLANTKKVKSIEDLAKPETVVAVNSKGDFTHVMLIGPLLNHGLDYTKTTVVEIGGSGNRVAALKAGRVDAVPMHIDQAHQLMAAEPGKYAIVIEPWKEFSPWISEVWIVGGGWLKTPENERATIDLLKATVTAFRKTNQDFSYFASAYRKYATITNAASAPEAEVRDVWQALSKDAKAWPDDGGFKRAYFDALLPVWKAAGGIEGKVDLGRLVETRYLEQAMKELSA